MASVCGRPIGASGFQSAHGSTAAVHCPDILRIFDNPRCRCAQPKNVAGDGAVLLVPVVGFFVTGTSARVASGSVAGAFLDEDITVLP